MSLARNTPLTARSVLASVLLGTEPPWLPTSLLVRTTALFGMSEGSTRTALSRLVAADEAVAERNGYRLTGRLVARQERSEEHTSELQSLMRISYAVFCLKKKKRNTMASQIQQKR